MKFQIIAGEAAVDFVNTVDNRPVAQRRVELLKSYPDLIDWALQAGLIRASVHGRLLRAAKKRNPAAALALSRAIELRECLFGIFSRLLSHRAPAKKDLGMFNRFLGEAMAHLQLKSNGRGLCVEWEEPAKLPLEWVLWPIVRSASELLTSDDIQYLRECGVETCRWLFVDRSKNHSRRWCDMRVCGNRIKARRFYVRQRQAR